MFQKYFEDEGTEIKQLEFLWCSAARYSRVEVMQWAHEQGYSVIWNLQNDWEGLLEQNMCNKSGQVRTTLCFAVVETKWVRLG